MAKTKKKKKKKKKKKNEDRGGEKDKSCEHTKWWDARLQYSMLQLKSTFFCRMP